MYVCFPQTTHSLLLQKPQQPFGVSLVPRLVAVKDKSTGVSVVAVRAFATAPKRGTTVLVTYRTSAVSLGFVLTDI